MGFRALTPRLELRQTRSLLCLTSSTIVPQPQHHVRLECPAYGGARDRVQLSCQRLVVELAGIVGKSGAQRFETSEPVTYLCRTLEIRV